MFIAWSDADADWVEKIENVSSFECEFVFNPLGLVVIVRGRGVGIREQKFNKYRFVTPTAAKCIFTLT